MVEDKSKGFHSLAENLKNEVAPSREVYYPTLSVTAKQLPGLDGEMGATGEIVIKYKITSVNQRNNEPKNFTLELKEGKIQKGD